MRMHVSNIKNMILNSAEYTRMAVTAQNISFSGKTVGKLKVSSQFDKEKRREICMFCAVSLIIIAYIPIGRFSYRL